MNRAFYETVLAANAKGREVSRAGITASDVDDAVQKVLEQSQFASFIRHKTGTWLGLDIHEAPQIMRGTAMCWSRGWSSPSSRGFTGMANAVSGSRTMSW